MLTKRPGPERLDDHALMGHDLVKMSSTWLLAPLRHKQSMGEGGMGREDKMK
jgi:hypothetical protein